MKNIYEVLRQKQIEMDRLSDEIEALRTAAKLLSDNKPPKPTKGQVLSQPQMVAEVLQRNGEPMHLKQVAEAIKRRFKRRVKTTHLAAVVYRNIKNGTLFFKVADRPNTFGLLEWQAQRPSSTQTARVA